MSGRVCLRCDWTGETAERACPNCGAGLFRTAPPAPVRRAPAERRERDGGGSSEALPIDARSRSYPRPGTRVVAALAAIAVSAAIVVVQLHTPGSGRAGAARGTGLDGWLVYADAVDPTWSRVWAWNLADGSVERGPRVRAPLEFVDASLAHPGWIGVTSALHGDRRGASVLVLEPPAARSLSIRRGRLVAWAPTGESVTVADETAGVGCDRRLTVWTHEFSLGTSATRYRGPVCGDLYSMGSTTSAPFLTLVHNGGSIVEMVGLGFLHPVLENRLLLSISIASDLLVVPASAVGPPPGTTSAQPPGLQLFYRSPLRDPPVEIQTGGENLYPEEVLAWSRDGTLAYVLGTVGGHDRGVYEIRVGPGSASHPPTRAPSLVVLTEAARVRATVASNDRLILALDDHVYVAGPDGLEALTVPDGAGSPDGPLVWSASLRYSAT
jgi:hypothetical protein